MFAIGESLYSKSRQPTTAAGFELATGIWINTGLPQRSADHSAIGQAEYTTEIDSSCMAGSADGCGRGSSEFALRDVEGCDSPNAVFGGVCLSEDEGAVTETDEI